MKNISKILGRGLNRVPSECETRALPIRQFVRLFCAQYLCIYIYIYIYMCVCVFALLYLSDLVTAVYGDGLQAGRPGNWGSIPGSSIHNVQAGSLTHLACYQMSIENSFPGGKVARA
jgi:hypothetical protein